MSKEYSVEFRKTGMGAYTDACIQTLDGAEIHPSFSEDSRTGNHGTRRWDNLPPGAVIDYINRSNSGKTYASRTVVAAAESGEPAYAYYQNGRWDGELPCPELPFAFEL